MMISQTDELHHFKLVFKLTSIDATRPQSIIDIGRVYRSNIYFLRMFKIFAQKINLTLALLSPPQNHLVALLNHAAVICQHSIAKNWTQYVSSV
jgi:hypothetical protein